MIKPAIVVVGYNRPDGIKRLLDSIGKAKYDVDNIPLIVSIDESAKSNEVECVAQKFEWTHGTKEIRRFPERQGLRKHIVQCGDLSEKYGGVIILEDDLIVAEDYYSYVCNAHNKYSADQRICGIALYSFSVNQFNHFRFIPEPSPYDVFLGDMIVTWGQSWTFNQWKGFKEFYLKNEDRLPAVNPNIPRDISGWTRSWGKYFASYMAEKNLSYIYPYISRTTCFSDFGEHSDTNIPLTFVQVPLMKGSPDKYRFGEIEQLVHYDGFYERVLDKSVIVEGIRGFDICMDLNNMKTSSSGRKYVLSNSKLPYKIIKSYGLTQKPISDNIINGIEGNQIHLYSLEQHNGLIRHWKGKRCWYRYDYKRYKYEYNDAFWRVLLQYTPYEVINRFFVMLGAMKKKVSNHLIHK